MLMVSHCCVGESGGDDDRGRSGLFDHGHHGGSHDYFGGNHCGGNIIPCSGRYCNLGGRCWSRPRDCRDHGCVGGCGRGLVGGP